MRTIEVNPTTRPDLFFPKRDTGEVEDVLDAAGVKTGTKPVYAYDQKILVDTTTYETPSLRRRSKRGEIDLRLYNDNTVLYHTIDGTTYKVASMRVFGESWDGKQWVRNKGARTTDMPAMGRIKAKVEEAHAHLEVDVDWVPGKDQQVYRVSYLGRLVRCILRIERFEEYEDLNIRFDDFKGNVEDSGWMDNIRAIIFEPAGVMDLLVVGGE